MTEKWQKSSQVNSWLSGPYKLNRHQYNRIGLSFDYVFESCLVAPKKLEKASENNYLFYDSDDEKTVGNLSR